MSFIAKHITHREERLMYLTRLHSILLVRGFLWMVILVSLGIYINWLILYKFEMLPSASVPFIPAPYSQRIDLMAGLLPALTGVMNWSRGTITSSLTAREMLSLTTAVFFRLSFQRGSCRIIACNLR